MSDLIDDDPFESDIEEDIVDIEQQLTDEESDEGSDSEMDSHDEGPEGSDDDDLSIDEDAHNIHISVSDNINRIPDNERTTMNVLNKFERVRMVSTRAEQIARGSAPTIDISHIKDIRPEIIAEEELRQGKIPLILRRYVGNKKYEEWNIKDLIIK